LTVFLTWYSLGGLRQPPTLTEIAAMPADLRHDILFLLREYSDAKDSQRAADRARKGGKRG